MKVKKKVKIKKKQETINNRLWERERRNKLNDAFGQLDRQLPDFDPSRARSKLAVLLASIAHIGHLQQLVETLSAEGGGGGGGGVGRCATQRDNVYVAELARLHERIDTLRARCQQLAQLLQMADIPVPAPPPPPAPRAVKEGGVLPIKWNGNIAHKTVQRRIINSRKEKAEKKENKDHAAVGSTASKKNQPPKKKLQKTIQTLNITNNTNITNLDDHEAKEPSSKLITSDSNESTYLSPVKNVINLCNTPLRELTGFTLNSASVAASSISSLSPSSLSSNSPAMSDTPDGQSTESAKTDGNTISYNSMPTNDVQSSMTESAKISSDVNTANDTMSSDSDVAMTTTYMTSSSAGNEQDATKQQTSGLNAHQSSTTSQLVMVGVEMPKSSSLVADTSAAVTTSTVAVESSTVSSGAVTSSIASSIVSVSPSTVSVTSVTAAVSSSTLADTSSTVSSVAVTSSTVSSVAVSSSIISSVAVTSSIVSSVALSSSSEMGSSKLVENEPNSSPSNSAPTVTQFLKKNESPPKTRPKTVTAKPVMVTQAAGNPIPVTGTVHVVNSMNPYPSIMPVTVANFATPTVNQSIMIVLPDGRVVSVPQQQPIQQQFVINPTSINHQTPTTIVIRNSAPVIEPIVFETAAADVSRVGKKRVLLSKQSNKVPIPMVGTQFVVRRTIEMKVKEKQVIEKRQKIRKVKKSVTSMVATRKVADKPESANATTENAHNKSTKQQECDVNNKKDAGKTGEDESSKMVNKDGSFDQTADENDDTSSAKVLCNSGVPTNSENVQSNKLKLSQKSNTLTKQDSTMRNKGDDDAAVSESYPLEVEKTVESSCTVAGGSSSTTNKITDSLSRKLISKPNQGKLGGKNVMMVDNHRLQDDMDLMENVQNGNQQNSSAEKVGNIDVDGNVLNIGDKNDDDNDDFGLDTMSDDNDDNDRNMTSLITTTQMKRPAESNDGPILKKLKTSEEQEIVAKMSLNCKVVLQKENFDMVAIEVVSSNVDDVPMVSDSADVSTEESSTFSQIRKKHNTYSEQCKLDASENLDFGGETMLDKTPFDNKDQKGNPTSSLVSNVIEKKLVDKCNQQPVGLLLQDIGNTFSASKNLNTHQELFGTQLENVVTNKCNEDKMLECYKRDSVSGQYGNKVSNDPSTQPSQVMSLASTASLNNLSNTPMDSSAEMNSILNCTPNQNLENISHTGTETIKEGNCPSKTLCYPQQSTENLTENGHVMENNTHISSLGLNAKESIKTPCLSMVTGDALPSNAENSLETFVRDSNFSESRLFPSVAMNKECIGGISVDTHALESTSKQNVQGIQTSDLNATNNNFATKPSNQNKTNVIGGNNKQQEIETQTLVNNKIDNSFGSLQQIVANNVLSSQESCGQSMQSTSMGTNSQSQIVSGFDSNLSSVSNNYRNLPATFWNSGSKHIIGSPAASSSTSMFSSSASNLNTNQNVLQSPETVVVGNNFENYSNTISASSTSIKSTTSIICSSSGVLPSFSMPMFPSTAANQNVINSSNLNLSKSLDNIVGGNFTNYSNIISASIISTSTSTICTSSNILSNKTSPTSSSSNSNKVSIISEQRPIVSYKIHDTGQKTVNPTPVSNVPQSSLSENQWNSKVRCLETANLHKVGEGGLNYLQLGHMSVAKKCDNCNNSGHNKLLDGCKHQQKIQKPLPVASTSKTSEITKTTSVVYNENTKIIGNKIKKDMSTNTSTEQAKVLYSSQKISVGNSSHDVARKEAGQDGMSSNKNNDKNVRKVMKKTVSQQTDDVNNGSIISCMNVGKTDVRKVAGGYKMKSTSSCQTVESVSSRTNACDKYLNSFGRGVALNKRKPSTFQVSYNAGQNNVKSGLAVGNNAVTNNKKSAATSVVTSTGDTLLQNQHNNMNMMSGLVPTSNHNTLVPVQHFKPATKQADMFVSKNQESKNAKKQDFKTVPPKEKSAVFLEDIRLVLPNSDFSNDIFSSLQVPSGSQHHGSLSPTAAFLDAFPLVSNSKNSELLIDGENNEAVQHAGVTLLQLGDTTESNILDTTGTQNCQQVLNDYNSSNIPRAQLAMNNDENTKNSCSKSTNSLHSDQLKTGSTGQQLQTSSHSISALNATKPVEGRFTEQTSKIQDYQSHYNVPYNYLSANSFQNYNNNNNSGYKKVAPKFAESANYSGSSASAGGINNTGFATNSQQFRDVNKMAATNYGQTNENRLNYNTYNNWNTKSAMQLQNADDFQTNYMSSYNQFPTSSSASKNVFGSDPSFSTGTTMFGNLPTYKSMDTNGANESGGFVSQSLPVSSSGSRKLGGKSSNSDAPATFIYTQASRSSNPVTTHSYSCVFSSASDFQASVGFPQPFYSSSAIDDPLNTAKVAAASKDPGPGQCGSTVVTSSVLSTSLKPVNSSKSNSSSKFYPGSNNALGKKSPAMFDNSLNKTVHQSNASTSKSSSYLPTLPTTLNANSFGNNANSTLFTGQTSYQTANVFSSSGSGANTTTTLANSKDGELVKTSTSTSSSQLRMPVNWMTMPDPRTSTLEVASSSASSSFIAPDRMFTPHKDVLDFIAPIITGCGNLQSTYSSMNNNSQMFYGLDFPASDVSQQPCGTDASNSKLTSTAASQQIPTSSSSIHYSWPNSKSSLSLLSHLDNHGLGIPSTLPTLVGDLALGTNTGPSTPAADGGFRVSSNAAANIFQTLPEVEERGNQLPTKPSNVSSDMPVKSSNYVLDLQPKSSTSFSTEVPSKSSNYLNMPANNFDTQSKLSNFPDAHTKSSHFHLDMQTKSSNFQLDAPTKSSNFSLHPKFSSTDVQSKPSNVFNVPSKSSNFLDTPAKSSNFHLDMPTKSTNCLNVQTASKPSNFFNVQPNSSNCLNRTSKSSNYSMDGQPQPNSTILQFNRNDDAKITESSKNEAQNQGNGPSVAESNKMSSSNNHSQQQQPQQIGGSFLSVSQLVDQVKTNNKQERMDNGNPYKYVQNIMPPDIYCPETSANSGRQSSGYKYNATQQKGVSNNFQTSKNSNNRGSCNLLLFDGGNSSTTTNQKPNLLVFDSSANNQKQSLLAFESGVNNQKQSLLSFEASTSNQKQNMVTFDSNTNQKPKETLQKSVAARKSESMIQNNYNDLNSSFLASSSTSLTTNSTSFVTTSLITTNSTPSSSSSFKNSMLPIPVSMPSTSSLWSQTSNNCANNNNNSCSTIKKPADGFSTKPSSTYKGSNKYSAESLISSDPIQDPAPNTDHFSTSTLLNLGACFETASHNELPSFGSSSTNLFGSSDYHHGDFSMMQNNQSMSSYQNYYGQTLDNLQPPNPSGFLADSADFQMMNLFDSNTPYSLFPAPSVPPARKSTEPQKSNLKTNQKSANNSTGVFYPSTTVSAVSTANECYQKLNSNFPPNCSSSATNLPLSSSTTNSLANFNMSTIFPEMNDKVDAAAAATSGSQHHMGQQLPATTVVAATATPQQQQQQQHGTTTGADATTVR